MVLKVLDLTVSTLRGCGGLERSDFKHFLLFRRYGSLERTNFNTFYFGKGMAVLKELILIISTL